MKFKLKIKKKCEISENIFPGDFQNITLTVQRNERRLRSLVLTRGVNCDTKKLKLN